MSKETEILRINARINLLNERDPVANANIIRKLNRRLNKLTNE